jgi:molybdenum cofactor synthesis domain-containing protein
MSKRILGLYNVKENGWDKRVYFHSNSLGEACVNGVSSRLALRRAGRVITYGADYEVIAPPDFDPPLERYIAIDTECLLWLDENARLHVWRSGFVGVSAKLSVLRRIRVGVLTVSDKGSKGEREDTAGPALAEMIESLGAEVIMRDIVPDERAAISEKLRNWADSSSVELILTTGGTGLSRRDVTPEAVMDVEDRTIPGFGEIMRSRSMEHTPRGFLSRSLAATRGSSLIVAFPGSERAVRQCFEAVAPSIRHAVEMLCGWDAECASHATA